MSRTILFFFILTFSTLSAQVLKQQDTLYANYLGQKEGLLQLNIKGIALDSLGYLWAGTEDGLHRFNSYEFKSFTHNPQDSTSLKDDHIRDLLFTKDILWIATNTKGIQGFIPSKNEFFSPDLPDFNNDFNTTYKVLKLDENRVLFSVKNHVIIYNHQTKSSKVIPLLSKKLESHVTDIIRVDDTHFWLGTTNSGILKLNIETLEINKIDFLHNELDICFYRLNNTIYLGSKNGMFSYNVFTKKLKKLNFDLSINCFYPKSKSAFFIGTQTGAFIYNIANESITPLTFKIDENTFYKTIDVNVILSDSKGNLWLGTEADGLIHYNSFQKKFNTQKIVLQEYPLKKNISSFQYLKNRDSTLWIGSAFGMVKYNHLTKDFKLYHKDKPVLIYTITKDKANTIWAGGFTSGLLKYNSRLDIFEKIQADEESLPDNDIVEIISIDTNTLWVCTWSGGIHEFNIKNKQFKEVLIQGERLNRVRTSLVDSNKNIWLGTEQGAYKISTDQTITKYFHEDIDESKLSSNRIFDIKEDNHGNIWLGTSSGLTKLDIKTNKTTLFYKQRGLPNDFIYSILTTKNNIWVSTNFGLSILETETNTFKNYTVSNGLQNNEFNGKAGYKDEFGNFYFGGITGINIFNPNKIIENSYIPETYIESVELFNKPLLDNVLYKNDLKFKSNENVLTFNFSAINYLNSEKCHYTYKMEGFDSDWRPITKNRSTTYTNLDPGKYTFKVKASNDLGIWNETPKTLAITIIPPWYETLAVKIAFIILLLLFTFLIYKYKTSKLNKDKLRLEEIVKLRTQELSAKNKDLKAAYNDANKQHNNIEFLMRELTHRVKNNLQIISSLLNIQANILEDSPKVNEALKVAKNRILTISHIEDKINTNNKNVNISDFIKEISNSIIKALSDDEYLKFKVEYTFCEATLKSSNTTLIGLILNELITNTTKYAFDEYNHKNTLSIGCEILPKSLRIKIIDNGKGYISEDTITGKSLGIELVTEMVAQLNGTIQITSTNGTKNIIDIPI
jgi:two-component sensor histidine kinase/ligand-binding sensor domain-containing protein